MFGQSKIRKKNLDIENDDSQSRPKLSECSISRGSSENQRARINKQDFLNTWPLRTTFKDIRQKQLDDSDFNIMIAWVESGKRPYGHVVQAVIPAFRHYWLLWDSLIMKEQLLHRWFYMSNSSSYFQSKV